MWSALTYAFQGVLFLALGVMALALVAIAINLLGIAALVFQDLLDEWRHNR